jgi:DNA-binding NarL/FixJ family response regulator
MKINILLADGRKLFREGLSLLLEKHEDLRVIGEAEDGRDVCKLVRALSGHVVILNLTPPLAGGTDLIRSIVRADPEVRVIALTLTPAATAVREILEAGALGCLTKECAAAELVTAIRTVMQGKVYLSPNLVDLVVSGYVRPSGDTPTQRPLAPREREVLRRIAGGQSTKEIAYALGVSAKTVETHRRRIMDKLGMHSVAELTKYAVLHGMTPLETPA